ncbi:hypothetical protein [Clostridium chromiireducens]|uniref:Uncharacterized protein n=1 Tax=Clostridium chromiireducens TaxID=225345 RepID=A0A1V4IF38_9CLOT|nr:hypothetical protein [Clostridium chromiireducens]OPJ58546.1 hypothetical protein CLCHR_38610 [Clostridium chromiireducens]RII36031.1 hypothetical protein D2A34_01270 [Clostridium chromiireducens]
MNDKTIKLLISLFIVLNCLIALSSPVIANSILNYKPDLELSVFYSQKDKDEKNRILNIFSEENYKYLSPDQKKQLLELKKCKDNGTAFSEEQQKTLHTLLDSIIKGRLGNDDYEDFKILIQKKKSNQSLTEEEDKRLKEYRDIINGSKPNTQDILNQFLR